MAKDFLLALAPMDGVTDAPFRQIVKKHGQPDLMFTEFANVEGICRGGALPILRHFDYSPSEQPLIAQIFGKTPAYFYQVAILVAQLGFVGVNINMGCPAKKVASHGSGAALIGKPKLAQEIIKATQQGIKDWANGKKLSDCSDISEKVLRDVWARQKRLGLSFEDKREVIPVSVKTRLGIEENIIKDWLPYLTDLNPESIILHGRTLKQAYSGEADWQAIAKAQKIVKAANPKIKFWGNGDVRDYEDAAIKAKGSGVDGIMIGRASYGNPFVFLAKEERKVAMQKISPFALAFEHALLFEKTYPDNPKYSFINMRKHLAWYIKSIPNAAEWRSKLVRANNASQVKQIYEAASRAL